MADRDYTQSGTPQEEQAASSRAGGTDALGDILGKLMAHPEVISYVASAIGMDPNASQAASPSSEPPSTEPAAPADTASVAEESVSAPVSASPAGGSAEDAMATIAPFLSGLSGLAKKAGGSSGGHKEKDCRAALLLALKPYVSHGRCEAIDYMLRFAKITDLLKQFH